MRALKWLHIAISGAACLLFLFIPLIFLTNINLMLFPDKWGAVHGFLSALGLPNVFPRYVHFVLACPAMAGLFLVWLFRRRQEAELQSTGFTRSELIRKGYQWAFWSTLAQFAVGPVALMTLPPVTEPVGSVMGIFGIAILLCIPMTFLMFQETRRSAETIGRSFSAICVLMLVVIGLMGAGRHVYREAALSPHRELVRAKTQEYMREVDQANREAAPHARAQ
jgi:cytochrome c